MPVVRARIRSGGSGLVLCPWLGSGLGSGLVLCLWFGSGSGSELRIGVVIGVGLGSGRGPRLELWVDSSQSYGDG